MSPCHDYSTCLEGDGWRALSVVCAKPRFSVRICSANELFALARFACRLNHSFFDNEVVWAVVGLRWWELQYASYEVCHLLAKYFLIILSLALCRFNKFLVALSYSRIPLS